VTLALSAVAVLVQSVPATVAAAARGVPLPRGWVGTTDDWEQVFGIAFVLLNLTMLVLAWRSLRPDGVSPTARGWLFVALGLVPTMVAFLAFAHGLERSTTVAACGSCHVMTPFVNDLGNVESETLAATHFKNRYIQERQCYTCHSDYGLAGTLKAKFEGLGHVWRYTTGSYVLPIKIAQPYPNSHCLGCHRESQKFLRSAGHPKEEIPNLMTGKTACLNCHGPAHPEPKKKASR
jgi:cytochrome c nitrite reductase small subunit